MASKLNVKDLSQNLQNTISENGFTIGVFNLQEDPENANRIRVSTPEVEVELLPSKVFSLSQAWIKGRPIFWEAPIGLPDTETIDLWSDEVFINGNPAPGFTFLKTLVGGVEMYGLKNWGMPASTMPPERLCTRFRARLSRTWRKIRFAFHTKNAFYRVGGRPLGGFLQVLFRIPS
jgi:hypothetical protein